jgi:hypothetical protein
VDTGERFDKFEARHSVLRRACELRKISIEPSVGANEFGHHFLGHTTKAIFDVSLQARRIRARDHHHFGANFRFIDMIGHGPAHLV